LSPELIVGRMNRIWKDEEKQFNAASDEAESGVAPVSSHGFNSGIRESRKFGDNISNSA